MNSCAGPWRGFQRQKISWCLYVIGTPLQEAAQREKLHQGPVSMRTWWKRNCFCSAASPLTHSERIVHCLHVNVASLYECSLPEQAAGGNITVEEASELCPGLIYRGVCWYMCDYCIIKHCRVFIGQIVVAKTFIKLSLITSCAMARQQDPRHSCSQTSFLSCLHCQKQLWRTSNISYPVKCLLLIINEFWLYTEVTRKHNIRTKNVLCVFSKSWMNKAKECKKFKWNR